MELAPIAYESAGLGLARSVQEREKQEAERESSALAFGDTVSISDEAREKLKSAAGGETADKKENSETNGDDAAFVGAGDSKNAEGLVSANSQSKKGISGTVDFTASAAGGVSSSEKMAERMAEIQKQIKDVQQQLTKAQEELQQKEAEPEETANADPDAPPSDSESPELKSARTRVTQLNSQLMQLNQQLQEVMRENGAGGGGGGQIQGTRAGSGGVGRIMAHVGEANDPYAAAAAFEAAEMGIQTPVSF